MKSLGAALAAVSPFAFVLVLTGLFYAPAICAESPYQPLVVVRPATPVVRSIEARELVDDINAARVAHGLSNVAVDDVLSRAALSFARDMAARRFFGHFTPEGESLPDRLAAAGFRWSVAAENIALDEDEQHANAALLRSAAHRANILDPRMRKIGVAALAVGIGAALYVEDFAL